METTPITIEKGRVTIRPAGGEIRLTSYQIADLFGVHVQAVNNHIGSIFKSGILREEEATHHVEAKSGSIQTLYNMEMITALAFRLKSEQAELFRQWIIRQATNPPLIWKIPGIDIMLN